MVKDIVFRATGEKAVSRADRKADADKVKQKRMQAGGVEVGRAAKKNISKKDADALRRSKMQ